MQHFRYIITDEIHRQGIIHIFDAEPLSQVCEGQSCQ